MIVFVAGATGETGRRVVKELVSRKIAVRALVRDLERGQDCLADSLAAADGSVELVVGDVLNMASLREAIADCTHLICATGARPNLNPTGPFLVDYVGTQNLVKVAKEANIQHFVLVSSMCVSQFFHFLNVFWLVLFWKAQAESYIQSSNLTYTIVRPGGLKNEDNTDNIVMAKADTLFEGSIPRTKVAQVAVDALFQPAAQNKVVEIVARSDAPPQTLDQLFAAV
ncbi:MAG: NAD(P)H-binding protein [Leptolyngbyaceae bacterium]|nr:NAD(P)H-binding protein [Leptolyngbyaceae bacterium]